MPKNQHTIPPARRLRLQKVQRGRRKQDGVYKTTYLAKVNGTIRLPGGLYWVHDPAGTDANGNTIYGAPRKMPMLAGAAIFPRPNTKVDVVTVRGVDYIARTNKSELDRMGVDAHQSNLLDQAVQFKALDWITNLQAFKTPGVSSTHIIGSIYKKPDGEYDAFPSTGGYDFVTANIPSTDMQVVVCQWLDTDTNTITTTVSSEESIDTDLKNAANIATTISLINECVEGAPSKHVGVWAWRIFDDTTIATLSDHNKLADLRGIIGGMDVSGNIIANTLVLNDGSELTIASDTITVTKARHTVDTEANAASDDLDTVNGLAANEVCVITASDTTRTVVIKHGVDNIVSVTGADISLDDNIKAVLLLGSIDGTEVWAYPLGGSSTTPTITDFTNATHNHTNATGGGQLTDAALSSPVGITKGGTGQTTQTDAMNALSPTTTKGDLLVDNGTNVIRLPVGFNNDVLIADSAQAAGVKWQSGYAKANDSVSLENHVIDMSANTVGYGEPVAKTLSSDVLAPTADRNIIVQAQSGTTDNLIEVQNLSVGETILLRADAGDTITVKHNDAGATIKIYLYANADKLLDEQNPLRLTLIEDFVMVEDVQNSGATTVSANKVHKFGVNQSTSSNTMVDVDATNAAITATLTGGGKCRVVFAFRAIKNTAGSGFFRLTDGTNSSNEVEVIQAASPELMVIHWVFDTSAGSTTYKLQYRSDNANTVTLQGGIAVGMTLLEVA